MGEESQYILCGQTIWNLEVDTYIALEGHTSVDAE
jgi:hypothetical protein